MPSETILDVKQLFNLKNPINKVAEDFERIHYQLKSFHELTLQELYDILKLRQEVFIVEQQCVYLDADGKDLYSYHVIGKNQADEVVCYTRLIPEGISYDGYVSIGRVINASTVRGQGQGKILMMQSLGYIKQLFPDRAIKIGAQSYLKLFYESFGFIDMNEPYIEDGIPHIIMVLEPT